MNMSTVPRNLTSDLLKFCRDISPEKPIFVRSSPSSDAQLSACFDNVARKIARAGGQVAYGWAIWFVPRLYFEAEHHGVWRNRRGALLDVSPQLGEVSKILFLPDPKAVYDPKKFRANIFRAAENTPAAAEFVALATARNALLNRYRTDEHVVAILSSGDQIELSRIDRRLRELWLLAGAPA